MKNFSDILYEAVKDLTPEQRRRYETLKQKRRSWLAKGKDVTAIEAELEALKNGTTAAQPAAAPAAPTTTTSVKDQKEYDKGYKDFVDKVKKIRSGEIDINDMSQAGQGGGGGNGLEPIPLKPEDIKQNQKNTQKQSGQSGSAQSGQSGSAQSGQSRNGKQSGQGVVRPEDCQSKVPSLSDTPGNAGGIISKEQGDKLAAEEGFDKEGGNEDSIAKEWKERAQRAASQMQGKGQGYERLKAKLDGMYRTTKDWKKELKKIVGHSISPEDKRSAYANKNILISQDRIARTDKDKYDNMDYMMAWIDTSGSMTQEYLNQCLNEIYQVALAKKPIKLVVVQFDTSVRDVQEFNSLGDLKRKMNKYELRGGGGTEVKGCFDMLLKDRKYNRRPAELVMIFTDGYLTQYKRNPRTMKNLVWVIVDNVSWELQYKDSQTKCIRLKSSDFGK